MHVTKVYSFYKQQNENCQVCLFLLSKSKQISNMVVTYMRNNLVDNITHIIINYIVIFSLFLTFNTIYKEL